MSQDHAESLDKKPVDRPGQQFERKRLARQLEQHVQLFRPEPEKTVHSSLRIEHGTKMDLVCFRKPNCCQPISERRPEPFRGFSYAARRGLEEALPEMRRQEDMIEAKIRQ